MFRAWVRLPIIVTTQFPKNVGTTREIVQRVGDPPEQIGEFVQYTLVTVQVELSHLLDLGGRRGVSYRELNQLEHSARLVVSRVSHYIEKLIPDGVRRGAELIPDLRPDLRK